MPKITRTAYAGGSLRAIAREIANQAHLDKADLSEVYGEELGPRKRADRPRRVRITITVEAEPAPRAVRGVGAPGSKLRLVQPHLQLEPGVNRITIYGKGGKQASTLVDVKPGESVTIPEAMGWAPK